MSEVGTSHLSKSVPAGPADAPKIPPELGFGFLTTEGDATQLMSPLDSHEPQDVDSIPQITVNFVDDRSSFAREVGWTVSAKFGYAAGDASGRASMSQKFHKSQRNVNFVLTKVTHTIQHFLRKPEWLGEAIASFNVDKDEFKYRYGDRCIDTVTRGGLLSIIYELKFKTMEEAEDFEANADISYGSAKGGASYHSRVMSTATNAAVSIQAIATGVLHAPDIIFRKKQGNDHSTTDIDGQDKQIAALFDYFDKFEEEVKADTGGIPLFTETRDIFRMPNAPGPRFDLSKENDLLARGAVLDDQIDDILSKVTYMKETAISWNKHVDMADVIAIEKDCNRLQQDLELALPRIAKLSDKNPSLPFDEKAIPEIPANWVLRELTAVKKFNRDLLRTDNYNAPCFAVPDSAEGKPAVIDLQVIYQGIVHIDNAAGVTLFWADAKGQKVGDDIFTKSWRGTVPNPNVDEHISVAIKAEYKTLNGVLFSRGRVLLKVNIALSM
jgi:hypothetical protein